MSLDDLLGTEPDPDPATVEGVIFVQPIPDFGVFAALLAALALLNPAVAAACDDAGRPGRMILTDRNQRHKATWMGRQGWRIDRAIARANKAA